LNDWPHYWIVELLLLLSKVSLGLEENEMGFCFWWLQKSPNLQKPMADLKI